MAQDIPSLRSFAEKISAELQQKVSLRKFLDIQVKINTIEIHFEEIIVILSLFRKERYYKKIGNIAMYYKFKKEIPDKSEIQRQILDPFCEVFADSYEKYHANQILSFEEVPWRSYLNYKGGVNGRVTMKVTGMCNENCWFCTQILDGTHYTLADIRGTVEGILQLEEYRHLDAERVLIDISGGEPTTHPLFFEILQYFIENVKLFRLHSNAVSFSKEKYLHALTMKKDLDVLVSLHSHIPEKYNTLTRTRHLFEKAVSGLKNLLTHSEGLIEVNHVLSADNIDDFEGFLQFFTKEFLSIRKEKIVLDYSPIILGVENPEKYKHISYTKLAQVIARVKSYVLENDFPLANAAYIWSMEVPLCILESITILTRHQELFTVQRVQEASLGTTYVEKCQQCFLKNYCVGIQISYLEEFGSDEMHAISEEEFNSSKALKDVVWIEAEKQLDGLMVVRD